MNILFVLYGDLGSNSANPLALYAREFSARGHHCSVAIPNNLGSAREHSNPAFRPVLYGDALNDPESIFADGRPADVVHAWTPRENVRHFVTAYMAKRPTPLVVYLEDHESWISCRALGLDEDSLGRQTGQSISERMPVALSHPFRYDSFIGLADAVVVIQEKLSVDVPAWVPSEAVMPGVDLDLFCPREDDDALRRRYGVADNEKVIVYPGGLNGFTRPAIDTLCRAVGLINQRGYPCRLLRTGPFALDFIDALPKAAANSVVDLGVLPRSELPALLALADVFVQPGKVDPFEDLRLPGKLPEYFAMGKPVITPDVNIGHLIRDGVDAVLTHTGTAEEIAEKCIAIFDDPQLAVRLGRAGRLFAEKNFDIKSQAPRMLGAYELARKSFSGSIAAEIWQYSRADDSVELLLARKLRLLANAGIANANASDLLRVCARLIESKKMRTDGLEFVVAERERQVAQLGHEVANRDGQIVALNQKIARTIEEIRMSFSWRITAPIRCVSTKIRNIVSTLKLLPKILHLGGGLAGSARKAWRILVCEGVSGVKRRILFAAGNGYGSVSAIASVEASQNSYQEWVRRYDTLTDEVRSAMRQQVADFENKPLVSIVMPTYNTNPAWLIEAIESVLNQLYPHWELCIADDASPNENIRPILEEYASKDARIKVVFREKNGHISAASNSALTLASGEWVALLDHDDLLTEHALYWVVDTINKHADLRLIYSDEDKVGENGQRVDAYFKCDWNEDLFYSHNLITHLGVYRRDVLNKIGGFRVGFEGSQDYDLALRYIEHITPQQIFHIPRVLYHWRVHAASTAQSSDAKPYALLAGEKALNEHLLRIGAKAQASIVPHGYRVKYELPEALPLVSLVIPTRNGLSLLRQCINSILNKTSYPNYEILIVDNGSDDVATLKYLEELAAGGRVRVIRDERPFNYSALNNAAVKLARGELVGLINNDIEVISPDWLGEMVSHALRPNIGAVGAKLFYSNGALQHGGVILGIGGVAAHAHKHFPMDSGGYFSRANLIQGLSAVTAACLVIRKSIYEEVGGLNEANLPVAFNDIDFCLRVREAGYRNIWTPYAELYHHESATRGFEDTPEKQARFLREVEYMRQRWGAQLDNDPAYNPNLTLDYENFSLAWPPRIAAGIVAGVK